MNFTENLSLTIQRPEAAGGGTSVGVLYGNKQGKYLIAGGFGAMRLEVGEELMARLKTEDQMIGFWVKVIQRIEADGTFYLFSFPTQVENLNLRKTERVSLYVPVSVRLKAKTDDGETEQTFVGALVNISAEGCRFNSNTFLEDYPWCELRFRLPGVEEEFLVEGRVIRGGRGKSDVATAGVRFAEPGDGKLAPGGIKEWISSSLPLAK